MYEKMPQIWLLKKWQLLYDYNVKIRAAKCGLRQLCLLETIFISNLFTTANTVWGPYNVFPINIMRKYLASCKNVDTKCTFSQNRVDLVDCVGWCFVASSLVSHRTSPWCSGAKSDHIWTRAWSWCRCPDWIWPWTWGHAVEASCQCSHTLKQIPAYLSILALNGNIMLY